LNRFKFRFLIAPFVFLGLLTNTGFAGPISRFVVVVPVYRELYSQNIGLLVRELYAQNLTGLPFSKVDVYFVVNHTVDASEDAKIENRETIEFLNELAAGRSPKVNPAHQILKDVTQNHISSRLNIHVVDLTRPGLRERNIGTVRDIGLKEVLKTVPAKEQANTIIAQMDGDTRVLKDFDTGTNLKLWRGCIKGKSLRTMLPPMENFSMLSIMKCLEGVVRASQRLPRL
jgi:hypothetical protein